MIEFKLGIDASSTLGPRTGVGRAALGLLQGLARLEAPDLRLKALLNSFTKSTGPEHDFPGRKNVELHRRRRPGPWLVGAWKEGRGPTLDEMIGPMDVALFPASYTAPKGKALRATVVHDLHFLDETGPLDPLGGGYFKAVFPKLLPAVDLVFTPSEFVRQQVLERYRLDEDRVRTLAWGLDHELFRPGGQVHVQETLHRLAVPDVFLLAVTAPGRRKRNGLLLDMYEELVRSSTATPRLVIAGCSGQALPELQGRENMYRRVHVLPRVTDEQLVHLYTAALAMIFTSSHEGFGFPVLEAMACGCPVVAGKTTAIPEVAGDAAILIEGKDPTDWAAAVRSLLDADTRSGWREKGLQRARLFQWETTARLALRVLKALDGRVM